MKKILFLSLFLVAALTVSAIKWYVRSDGNDTHAGTSEAPFRTLQRAANAAGNAYDTVFVMNHVLNSSVVFFGIHTSLMGYDTTTSKIICSGNSTNLAWYSATPVAGNFKIANLTIEGNMVAYGAIMITRVGGATVDNVVIQKFLNGGLHLYAPETTFPAVDGFTVTNCKLINNTRYLQPGSYGNLWITGTKNITVKHNYIEASYRAGDSAGFCFKTSHAYNALIDSNEFRVIGHNDGAKWAFAIEMNYNFGGITITNNRLQGVVDFAGTNNIKGDKPYSILMENNIIGHDQLSSYVNYGILLECGTEISDVIIRNNIIKNVAYAISFYGLNGSNHKRIYIHHNLLYDIGYIYNGGTGYAIEAKSSNISAVMRDIYIDNNVIVGETSVLGSPVTAVALPYRSVARNWNIRNNIIVGFTNSPILTNGGYLTGTIDTLNIQNNIMYQNGNSNEPKYWGIQPTHVVLQNTLKSDPLFVANGNNFALQTLSPAINSGLDLGYTTDFVGATIDVTPDRGSYEYVEEAEVVVPTVILDPPYNTTSKGITIYGYVANDGGGTISERGIVWNTSSNPTVLNNKQTSGSGLGIFKNVLSGLLPSTTYYLRGYAINEAGTAYSNEIVINTTFSSTTWDKGRIIRKNGTIKVF